MIRSIAAFCALFLAAGGLARAEPLAHLADKAEITDDAGGVHLSVPVTAPVPWKVWLADDPPRLIIDFKGLSWDREPELKSSSIAEMQVAPISEDWLRVVAYLREPLTVIEAEMVTEGEGAVLELVLGATTGGDFKTQAGELDEPVAQAEAPRLVVVLDPGHGGRDPGAEAGDVNEAGLMLDFAFTLKELLEGSNLFDVRLTRVDDVFVPLDERMSRARAAGADVFLSLHADRLAEGTGEASGLVLYSLGGESLPGARNVMRGAGDDILQGVDLSEAGDEVALALAALQSQDTAPRTAALSRSLLGALNASEIRLNSRPERQGNFAVLMAADVPSILVELGFLSSAEDLALLTSPEWHLSAAEALRDGLMQWAEEDRLMRAALGN